MNADARCGCSRATELQEERSTAQNVKRPDLTPTRLPSRRTSGLTDVLAIGQ